ncbi:hypothetical protein [Leptolyngbya sp. FACHB-261]|uniref:hypothetical protein n=1 Tax=Leptolyngbya sp. FACHB-261 TaxID=2692806 RepID=UPI001689A629|nr:hypothetical protein [Leptolyngbya sp. FACHB-261]MBD2104461.1 hypothetical protein [Leptolyngbya sp. FACHB-261]
MSRQKRTSPILAKAEQRAIGLKNISAQLTLENSLSLEKYNSEIDRIRGQLATYNSLLAQIDVAQAELKENETLLKHMTEDMLIGVASKFGKNSYQYQLAGGTRRSERKRPSRTAKPAIAS